MNWNVEWPVIDTQAKDAEIEKLLAQLREQDLGIEKLKAENRHLLSKVVSLEAEKRRASERFGA